MIRRIEISEAARAWGLNPHVVEKDYVIGWVLMGLSNLDQQMHGYDAVSKRLSLG